MGNEINKGKILKAFEILSNGETFKETLTNSLILSSFILDQGGSLSNETNKRVEVVVSASMLNSPYKIVIEEQKRCP